MPEKEKKRRLSKQKLKYLKNHLEASSRVLEEPQEEKSTSFSVLFASVAILTILGVYHFSDLL